MSLAASIGSVFSFPSAEKRGNFVRDSWDRLSPLPGGKAIVSRLIGMAAPYTGTIGARIVELDRGHCRSELPDRRRVRNHLNCVHAIALANLAELTGNAAVAYTLPDDARFIVASMSIEYLKKARGTITAEARCPLFESNAKAEHEIEVSLRDRAGVEVARAQLRSLIGPKK